jgi:hypothetical protein
VASATLRRAGWGVAAGLAGALLLALALHGRRPEPGLARFETAGVMTGIRPEEAREVTVAAGGRGWRFRRGEDGRWTAGDAPAGPDAAAAVERGLQFLHVSAPQRVLEADEVAPSAAEFGLAPPRFVVAVRARGGAQFSIEFGALNAQGLAQYARVPGRDTLLLLPRFVGEPWQAATGLP